MRAVPKSVTLFFIMLDFKKKMSDTTFSFTAHTQAGIHIIPYT